MIHYSNIWSTEVENLPGLVVHGPLNLINILDFWRDVYAKGDVSTPSKISYRAVAPLYAGDEYTVSTESASDDRLASIVVSSADGKIHMTGKISSTC
jgi:hydroxyacyl-ACP dehydratase HTD2-like protein with hotdog domain